MPQPALHVALANGVCRRWLNAPHSAPFPLGEATVNAFRHGSLGPDMGLFPGADREISEFAHTLATGRLARALLDRARNAVEAAFAWGWVSHVLADVHIHPLVNDAADRLPADSPGGRCRDVGHVMVESGLDAWFLRRAGRLPHTRLRHAFGLGGARFITDAFDDTYDLEIDERRMLGFHRNVTRWYSPYLLLAGRIADHHTRDPVDRRGVLGGATALVRRLVGPATSASGFLEAVPPTADLIERAKLGIVRHDEDMLRYAATGLDDLEDWNLETGERIEWHRAPAVA